MCVAALDGCRYPETMPAKRVIRELRRSPVLRFVFRYFEVLLVMGLVTVAGLKYYVDLQTQSFAEMQQSGVIRVLISDDPDSVYLFNKQHYGFEYELLLQQAFRYTTNTKQRTCIYFIIKDARCHWQIYNRNSIEALVSIDNF